MKCFLLLIFAFGLAGNAHAVEERRHPWEILALTHPDEVLKILPIARSSLAKDDHVEFARLAFAEANACRVLADWNCQRRAAIIAIQEADKTNSYYLRVRARILHGRTLASLGDFNMATSRLAEAQLLLADRKDNELRADIQLVYSELTFKIGKVQESYRYAKQGLSSASAHDLREMRIRLLRNMARADSELGRLVQAKESLSEANALLRGIEDPKLTAEIYLEQARFAWREGDSAKLDVLAKSIAEQAEKLPNSQLRGRSYSVSAQAAQMRGESEKAISLYQKAADEFAKQKLRHDERLAVREIVNIQAKSAKNDVFARSVIRLNELSDEVNRIEHESAVADFEERLEYAQSEAQLIAMNQKLENERLRLLVSENKFNHMLLASFLAFIVLVVFKLLYLSQRRYSKNMKERNMEMEQVLLQTSHDMRNPLSGILGMSELLASMEMPATQKEKVGAIHQAGTSLLTLAQDLLDRARIKGSKLKLYPEPTDLAELVNQLGLLYQPCATKKKLQLEVSLANAIPAFVLVDANRLQQVLGNLIGNALKYSERGCILLEVFCINSTPKDEQMSIRFLVKDQGPGIAKSDQERLFKPFERGVHDKKFVAGAGLGLAFAKDLVKLMGGSLEVTSTVGSGSIFGFTLQLPIVKVSQDFSSQIVEPNERARIVNQKSLRVLAVDDDPIVLQLLGYQISALGHTVQCYSSPFEALAAAEIQFFDAVILDYEMTGMNGPELAVKLRELQGSTAPSKLILISAYEQGSVSGSESIDAWLVKPIKMEQLSEVLDTNDLKPSN